MDSYVQGVEIMSKGGSSGSTTTTVMADPAFKQMALENYEFAKQVAGQEYTPYGGARIAAPTAATQLGLQQLASAGAMGPGTQTVDYATALALQPTSIAGNIQQYINPFQQQVIGTALQNIENQRAQQQLQNAAAATRARAFGGSRQGVVEGLTNQAALMAAGQTAGNLAYQGFGQAAQLAQQDVATRQAQAAQLAGLGAQQQAIRQQQAQQLLGVGAQEQAQQQAQLDLAYQDFLRQQGYPLQQLAIRQSALGGVPQGQQTTQPYFTNTGASVLGGALAGSALGGTILGPAGLGLAGTAGLGSAYGAGLGGLLGFLSDENMKESRQPVKGERVLSAIAKMPIDSWMYKEELGDSNRHIGPMAQDVQKNLGIGNGKMIPVVDMMGMNLAAIKELAKKVDKLQKRG
jgi:hypothetical protein